MAYTTINKSTDYFNTVLYTGTGSTQSITSLDFQPDCTWIKDRTVGFDHVLQDSVRGTTKIINTNQTYAEFTNANSITSFNSDGFTTGSYVATNQNTTTYTSWNWKANGSGSANTDGSISSTVSANTTAGFSIVKWTGDSSASATVGHGLGTTPAVIITKELGGTDYWHVYHKNLSTNHNLFLNINLAELNPVDGTLANVGSSTFGFQGATNVIAVNESGIDNIGYCFAEKPGYSKFGSYTGNSNIDGPFIYTGFKPAWVMVKMINGADDWQILDNKRSPHNIVGGYLRPNSSSATTDNDVIDFTSNGFKLRSSAGSWNHSSYQYIYMAFGQSIVGSNNVPATAR